MRGSLKWPSQCVESQAACEHGYLNSPSLLLMPGSEMCSQILLGAKSDQGKSALLGCSHPTPFLTLRFQEEHELEGQPSGRSDASSPLVRVQSTAVSMAFSSGSPTRVPSSSCISEWQVAMTRCVSIGMSDTGVTSFPSLQQKPKAMFMHLITPDYHTLQLLISL